MTLRLARPDDLSAVDDLLGRSYPRLLAADYAPSVMVALVPMLCRAKPELLASGRYFVACEPSGRILGAGGYSLAAQGGRVAQIRHVATDPNAVRQGIGRSVMQAIFEAAQTEGAAMFECLSTITAAPFYASVGFRNLGPVHVPMTPAMSFPAIRMWREWP